MGLFLLVAGFVGGVGPGQVLGRFDPAGTGVPLPDALMHLAMSGLYGVGLALVLHVLAARGAGWRRFGWLLGAVYGVALWLVAPSLLASGLGAALMDIPAVQFMTAHVVYGAVLGYVLGRHQPA
jgi:hypothetical protein